MKRSLHSLRNVVLLISGAMVAVSTRANTNVWTAASGDNLLWSTPANWMPAGPPGTNDEARFFDLGSSGDNLTITTIIATNTTVRSVWVGQTNGTHNFMINDGVTLTVKGANQNGAGAIGSTTPPLEAVDSTYYVGTKAGVSATQVVTNSVGGAGTLRLDNPNNELLVRQTFSGSGQHRGVLDMRGLNNFVANLGRIRVGDGEAQPLLRAEGQVWLAKTNLITLSGPSQDDNVELVVGNNDVNNNGNSAASYFYLGQENTINVDEVLIGARKTPGNFLFNPDLLLPSVTLRGSNGVARVRLLRMGDESDQANSGNGTTGTINLNNGTSDILADTVIVGKSQQQGGAAATGNLILGAGKADINTLEVAYQTDNLAVNPVTGNVTFNGTGVKVNTLLRLGHSSGAAPARNATLNMNTGTLTVAGTIATEGTATVRLTNATLAVTGNAGLLASTLVLDGGTISNASSVTVTNSLVIANGGGILGNPVFNMGGSGAAVWDFQGSPAGGLVFSNTFKGSGNFYGNLEQAPGAILSPGGDGTVGTLTLATANGRLDGGVLRFDLSNSGFGLNDQFYVTGALTLAGTNNVELSALSGVFDTANPYLLLNSSQLIGDQSYFKVTGRLAQSRYNFTFDTTTTPNAVNMKVGGSGPASLTWVGDDVANVWSTTVSNWNNGAVKDRFYSLDSVAFTDSGSATPSVSLAGTLSPGPVSVNNSSKNYVFSGNGGLSGAPLTKDGAGSLTFTNTGDDIFTGPVQVQNGALIFANTGLNTFSAGLSVSAGVVVFSGSGANSFIQPSSGANGITVGNGTSVIFSNSAANSFAGSYLDVEGAMRINQSVNSTLDGVLVGNGTFIKEGSGTLTMAMDNSFINSIIQVNGGTMIAGAANSLGAVGVTVASGAQVDLSGKNLAFLPVVVSGAGPGGTGALVNNGAPQAQALMMLTLAGDTTVGGSGPYNTDPVLNFGRWDLRGGTLSTSNQPVTLTKVGLNQVGISASTVDPALGDIDVKQGLLSFEGGTTSMGDPSKTLLIEAGASVSFFDTTNLWNKKFVLIGNSTTPNLLNYDGTNIIAGQVTLSNNCVIGAVPPDRGTPVSLTLAGPVTGPGSLIKPSQDTLVLAGTNDYSGATTVSGGFLSVDGINMGAGAITVSGGALGGAGRINGAVTIGAGGALAPGNSNSPIAALTIANTLTLGGATYMDLGKTGVVTTSDQVINIATLMLGGSLQLNIAGDPLAAGDVFHLFASTSASGAFASINPPAPGAGLAWDTSTLTVDGTLRVINASEVRPRIASIKASGGNLSISGIGGQPGQNYYVLTATSLALPLTNWTSIATNQYDGGGNFSFQTPVGPGAPVRFFILQQPQP